MPCLILRAWTQHSMKQPKYRWVVLRRDPSNSPAATSCVCRLIRQYHRPLSIKKGRLSTSIHLYPHLSTSFYSTSIHIIPHLSTSFHIYPHQSTSIIIYSHLYSHPLIMIPTCSQDRWAEVQLRVNVATHADAEGQPVSKLDLPLGLNFQPWPL